MDKQKICLISFDNWHYDEHIITALQKKNTDATHINFGCYKHANVWARVYNTLNKIFLNRNLKIKKRQDFILDTLQKIGKQDQILVINPELIAEEYHLEIKKYTKKYIAYLYDSVARCPVNHLLDGIFDEIYSFDLTDISNYKFKQITNYIYQSKKPIAQNNLSGIFFIASLDNRFSFLNKIAFELDKLNLPFTFIIVGKGTILKILKNKLSQFLDKSKSYAINASILFKTKRIESHELDVYYTQNNVILDLIRDNQTGLSFRIFEALAHQKKIITNNPTIVNYSFYNPNNILLIDEENLQIESSFFTKPYEPLSEDVYNQYTVDNWVDIVFNLKS